MKRLFIYEWVFLLFTLDPDQLAGAVEYTNSISTKE